MRKNLFLLLVIVLLSGVAYYYIYQSSGDSLPAAADFSVDNIDRVHKIFIADMEGSDVTLVRQNGQWLVNGQYKVRQQAMKNLLTVLKEVEVSAPVPKEAKERVLNNLATNNIKVELYNSDEELIKTFFVGGSTNHDEGTYMMIKGTDQPYITHIPGFKGYLTPRFITDSTQWRSRIVMNFRPASIKTVTLKYPRQPEHSYRITALPEDSFKVTPLHQPPITDKTVNFAGIKKYLTFFKKVAIENYINQHPKKDSIRSTTPYAILQVTDRQGNTEEVIAYPKPTKRGTKKQFTKSGKPTRYDPDRKYGVVNNGQDFAIIQTCPRICVFGKLFRKYEDFFISPDQRKQRKRRRAAP